MKLTGKLPLATYLATLGMEMSCIYLWLAVFREGLGFSQLSFALIVVLYPVPFIISLITDRLAGAGRGLLMLKASPGIAIVCAVVGLGVWRILAGDYATAMTAGIVGIGLQAGFCCISWWLGNSLARSEMGYYDICARFQVGILALLALGVVGGKSFLPVVIFFTMAVLALAFARWQTSASRSMGVLCGLPIRSLILGSAAVIIPGGIVFLGLSPEVARAILRWLWAEGSNLSRLLGLDQPRPSAGEPIELGLSCSFKPSGEERAALPTPPAASDGIGLQIPPIVLWLGVVAVFLGVLFLVILVTMRAGVRRERRSINDAGFEATLSPMNLVAGLATFTRAIGKKVRDLLGFLLSFWHLERTKPVKEDERVFSARALYRNLLRWAAERGLPRPPAYTPLEYLKVLCQKFPDKGGDLAVVTDAYMEARYGHSPASSESFAAAETAWRKIKS